MEPNELIEKVRSWSQRDDRVSAAGLCGSHARGVAGPNSDIDFCILTPDPNSLLEDRAGVYSLGIDVRVSGAIEDYNLIQSVRVFFGPTEAEFGITDLAWAEAPIDPETAGVMNDGFQVLYDPDRRLERAIAHAAKVSR